MIDLNKIEAAAKAATQGVWHRDFTRVTAKELGWDRVADTEFDNDSMVENATHIATANPAAVLEMVSMIRERDAVLRQALDAFEGADQIDTDMRDAINAIREVLEP